MSSDARLGKRKTVNMNEEVAVELNRLANSSGKTLYSLANEIGIHALEANKDGFSLDQAISSNKLLQSAKKSRMVLVNQDLWYYASTQAMRASKEHWLKRVRESAQWLANVFVVGGTNEEFTASVRKLITDFFWDCTEISISEMKGSEGLALKLAFVPEMPMEHTQGLFKTLEVIFNVHGYIATSSTVRPGYILSEFKKVNLGTKKQEAGRA